MSEIEKLGFVRVAAGVPLVRPTRVAENLASIKRLAKKAAQRGVRVLVFPELCLTGYTCADLFYRADLLKEAETALLDYVTSQASVHGLLSVVGLPLRVGGRLFNCAAVVLGGRLLGVVPKSYLPNTHEFYEARWFVSAFEATVQEVSIGDQVVPFGNDLVFDLGNGAVVGVEICEDMWATVPPSSRLALQGANIILNLSGSNELVSKTDYRRALVLGQSARAIAAYVYAGAGVGESTTDLVFGGHTLVAENGALLAEGERFVRDEFLTVADVDVEFLDFERTSNAAFRAGTCQVDGVRHLGAPLDMASYGEADEILNRPLDPYPFVPHNAQDRDARCEEVLSIQATGLATRLAAIGCRTVVLGLSGGLDSSLALLVCVEAFDRLGLDRKGIRALTLPGFGTTRRTRGNAERLAEGLGVALETIDITPMARQHLADLGRDETEKDITYENTQARGRTYLLMDKANQLGGIVVGTGDLSELALGWCTYNGDQMSMYGVNAGVPKTLVRYVVEWYAERRCEGVAQQTLRDVLATPVSPELLPANGDGTIAQVTEDKVGPYALHDFFIYHYVRRGASVEKIEYLATRAFDGEYSPETVSRWLGVFVRRFRTQQFKRSCMPDGPKVGSINLSPRGDWRMPSDVGV